MKKYEYTLINISELKKDSINLKNQLNLLGKSGWRLCISANDELIFIREVERWEIV